MWMARTRFFFSSRRRHTRWPRDWSSDVCSSDLRSGELEVCEPTGTRSWECWEGDTPIAIAGQLTCYPEVGEEVRPVGSQVDHDPEIIQSERVDESLAWIEVTRQFHQTDRTSTRLELFFATAHPLALGT